MKNLVLIATSLLISSLGYAATITVDDDGPADYSTIQAAIDAAVNGDTVIVADGIYIGAGNRDINFLGKAITVKSENGPTHCIIDASDEVTSHRGFIFESSETSTSVVEGFTITGGSISSGGGGIFCFISTPKIINCIFFGNSTEDTGGAIQYYNGCYDWEALQIKNSTFYGNVAGYGGVSSIIGTQFNEINFSNCLFKNNVATQDVSTNNFHEQITAKCGPVYTTVDYSVLDAEWFNGQNSIVADPLFADPNNGDFHVRSTTGRWDPNALAWVVDAVMSPAIDAGDPADGGWAAEPSPNANRINAGAYGGTSEASMSELLCINEQASCYDDWVAFEMPDCWCYIKQCRGNADGIYQGAAKCGYAAVSTMDLSILANAWQVKEPPFGPGILSIPQGICADLNHTAQGSDKTGYVRVGTNDLTIMATYWQIKEPPQAPPYPDCPLYPAGCINYYTSP